MSTYDAYQNTTCKIVGFFGEPYGKYPIGTDMVAFMEYDYWFQNAASSLKPTPPQEFLDWIASEPTINDQYADMLMFTLPLPRWKWY